MVRFAYVLNTVMDLSNYLAFFKKFLIDIYFMFMKRSSKNLKIYFAKNRYIKVTNAKLDVFLLMTSRSFYGAMVTVEA